MLLASLPAQAGDPPLRIDAPAAARETVIVRPENEDLTPPEPNRWEKMERALGRGRSAKTTWVDWTDNSGVRMACRNPCPLPLGINCCVGSGTAFSIAAPKFKGAW